MRERCIARRAIGMFTPVVLAITVFCTAAYPNELSVPIAAQPLADALEAFAKSSGYQLVYRADLAAGSTSPGAEAHLPALETLAQLLRGTGLSFQFVNDPDR